MENMQNVRLEQAQRLWYRGIERGFGFRDFKSYFATIPEIPEKMWGDDAEFQYLVLIYGRTSLSRLCQLAGVEMDVREDELISHDARHADFSAPTWIRVQDGRRNSGKSVLDCRTEFHSYELGLTAFQGVSAVIQHPALVADWNGSEGSTHIMDLPGSVYRRSRTYATFFGRYDGQLRLCWYQRGVGHREHGSASRRE